MEIICWHDQFVINMERIKVNIEEFNDHFEVDGYELIDVVMLDKLIDEIIVLRETSKSERKIIVAFRKKVVELYFKLKNCVPVVIDGTETVRSVNRQSKINKPDRKEKIPVRKGKKKSVQNINK